MDRQARILIVDDDVLNRESMRRVLEFEDYQVFLAESGHEALDQLRKYQLDLVLLDINMADMNGFEVCQSIKSDPQLADISVIMLSGGMIKTEHKVTGLNLGADDYITRPIQNRELLARIRAVLRVKVAEVALRSREKQLQDLISANIDGLLVLDPQGTVCLVNDSACHLLNRSHAELLGVRLGLPAGLELEIALPVGGLRILELRYTPFQWQETPASLVSLRDITSSKQAEEKLRDSEEKYRLLTESIKDVVWTMDAESQRFTYISPSVQNLRGYTPEEIMAEAVDAALSPQGVAIVRNIMSQHIVDFLAGKFGSDHFFVNEVDQPCKDGSSVWTEVVTSYFINNKTGRVEVRGVTRDITERRRMEEELRENEKRYAVTLDAVKDGIWDWQVLSGEATFSKNFYTILGYAENEFPATFIAWRTLVHPDDLRPAEKFLYQSINSGEAFSIDLRMQMKGKEWRWFCCRGKVVERQADGRALRMLGTLSDISARKAAEFELREAHAKLEQRVEERTTELKVANLALENASRLKDEFLASMSHELRTPLTGILGLAQVLQLQTYGAQNEKQLAALYNIETSGRHLLELINDILDYSRIEAGKLDLRIAPCSLTEICQASLNAIKPLTQEKKQQTSFTIDPSSIMVLGDVRRLKQVLIDLLSNAVKFTPGGGSLGIDVNGHESPGYVRITIWDTGIGIQPEDFPRLFQPFTQLDARLERVYNGTGLGLALVKRLVELHGGTVWVESAPGMGSRFSISLPANQPSG